MPPSVLRVLLCVKVNPDGGLLSKGHPIGATGAVACGPQPRALRSLPRWRSRARDSCGACLTGLIQCYELVVQLRRRAGARQVHQPPPPLLEPTLALHELCGRAHGGERTAHGVLRLGSWGWPDLRPARAPAQVREAAVALQHNFGIGSTCVVTVYRGPSRPSPSRL